MRVSAELPLGVVSLFGAAARHRRRLEQILERGLEAAGFEEVILPILDYVEPYEPLLTPAFRTELYRFSDRDGELLALRADFTPLLARLLAPRLEALSLPMRLFYRGEVVRYQQERVGRRRELYQMGGEIIGVPGLEGEREALERFLSLLTQVTGEPLRVVLGVAGALDELLATVEDPQAVASAVERREREVARAVAPGLLEVVEWGVPEDTRCLGRPAQRRLVTVQELANELRRAFPAVDLAVDLAEFAGVSLDPALGAGRGGRGYYDGIVFRAYRGREAQPVGGGGRYDRLFERLGAPVAAVGFSFGLDSLADRSSEVEAGEGSAGGFR